MYPDLSESQIILPLSKNLINVEADFNQTKAILNVKIKYIRQWIENRRAAADFYNEKLSEIEEIDTPKEHNQCEHSYHLYVIKTNNREGLAKFLNQKGIETGIHYNPIHKMTFYHSKQKLPVTESISKKIVSLPIHPNLTESEISKIIRVSNRYS